MGNIHYYKNKPGHEKNQQTPNAADKPNNPRSEYCNRDKGIAKRKIEIEHGLGNNNLIHKRLNQRNCAHG